MSEPLFLSLTAPPRPGFCKLRIKSDGTFEGTRVLVVDDLGVERELLFVSGVSWSVKPPNVAESTLQVDAVEVVEVDAQFCRVEASCVEEVSS